MPDAHGGRRRVHLQTLSITPFHKLAFLANDQPISGDKRVVIRV
jgi:hypothetical protein